MVLKVHIKGDNLRCDMLITDYDNVGYSPDSHSIQLYTPTGEASGSAKTSPTDNDPGAGDFSQEFTIPSDAVSGNWRIRWTTTTGGVDHSEDVWFEVKQ